MLSRKLCFAPLFSQDLDYSIQIISAVNEASESQLQAHAELLATSAHTPVAITGRLKNRDEQPRESLGGMKKILTKEIELQHIQRLNEFPSDIIMKQETAFPPEQRHLQLRQDKHIRDALRLRSTVSKISRNFLGDRDFVEVETPVLFKATPEGAREFLVPTQRPGLAYALPQSPQQYKQILMSSGISKYYQIARCFRDEDLRADRQPEFTQVMALAVSNPFIANLILQLDLEMSFATGEDVVRLVEELIQTLWNEVFGKALPSSFPRMTYEEAMAKYGSDKPDTRLGMEISRLDYVLPVDLVRMISDLNAPIIEGFCLRLTDPDAGSTRSLVSGLLDSADGEEFAKNPDGAPGIFIYDTSKPLQGLSAFGFEGAEEVERILEPVDGDLIVIQARPNADFTGGSTALGNLRLALHRLSTKAGLVPEMAHVFSPLWVTDFPLFSPVSDSEPGQGGSAGLASTHHPFTSPKTPADVDLLTTNPSKAIADHYDLVVNGVEIGGGSRRIHNASMQRFVMEEVLRMSPERIADFDHLLEALRAGCPPHAGIALGFDRLVALIHGSESIRDVIAFPKTHRGEDPMVHSPSLMRKETLDLYHLQVRDS